MLEIQQWASGPGESAAGATSKRESGVTTQWRKEEEVGTLLLNNDKNNVIAILAILHLCLLRYFPSTNLVDRADNCYTSLYFYFSSFSMFIQSRISKLVVICSCCSFLFFPPIYLFHSTLFYSSFFTTPFVVKFKG